MSDQITLICQTYNISIHSVIMMLLYPCKSPGECAITFATDIRNSICQIISMIDIIFHYVNLLGNLNV